MEINDYIMTAGNKPPIVTTTLKLHPSFTIYQKLEQNGDDKSQRPYN